ncbi:hypothetical protein MD484_g1023, partial [Candolleomyces efflorescens]
MSPSSRSGQSAGTPIGDALLTLRDLILDRLDTIVLAACAEIGDDGTVVLDENFDIMKAVSTQFHICPRCRAESMVNVGTQQAKDAESPPAGHSDPTLDVSPATDRRDEPRKKASKKKSAISTKEKPTSSSSRKAAGTPTADRVTRRANNFSQSVRNTYFNLRSQFKVGSGFNRALLSELDERIQAAIEVNKLERENPNMKIEVICLSKATMGDLEKIGVKAEWPGKGPMYFREEHADTLLEAGGLSINDVLKERKEIASLCRNLRTILNSFGSEFEPRARAIIDDFCKSLMRILQQCPLVKDGEKWIFGVTWEHAEGAGYRYDTVTIDELTDPDTGLARSDLESRSEIILKTITCWATVSPQYLVELIREARVASSIVQE